MSALVTRGTAAISLLALAACSGGGVASTPIATTTPAAVAPAATERAPVTITIRVPNAVGAAPTAVDRRSPQYLSYATKSAVVSYTNNGGAPTQVVFAQLNPSSTGCASQGADVVCTTTTYAPVGTDVFSATTYDAVQAPNATSNFAGNVLSTLSGFPQTVTAGTNTPVALTLSGVVASGKVVIANPNLAANGTNQQTPFEFFGYDADNFLIVGTYQAPVTITDSDTSGATNLSVNGAPGQTSVPVTKSSDALVLSYSGGALSSATLSAKSAQTNNPALTSATFTPVAASTTRELLYVGAQGGTDGTENQGSTYLFDLSTATSTGTSNGIPVSSLSYLYKIGNSGFARTSLQNALVYTEQTSSGTANGIEYIAEQPIPANASTQPAYFTPTGQIGTQFDGTPVFLNDGEILAGGTLDQSGGIAQVNAFTPFGAVGVINPARSFTLGTIDSVFDSLHVDPQGNLWVVGSIGSGQGAVLEYAASDVTGAANGATINPITVIATGSGPAQLKLAGGYNGSDLAFDATGNVYVVSSISGGTTSTVDVFASSVRGTTGSPNAIEYFSPQNPANPNVNYQAIAVEPSTGYILLNEGFFNNGNGIDFYQGVGPGTPPQGGTVSPFRIYRAPGVRTGGALNFLH